MSRGFTASNEAILDDAFIHWVILAHFEFPTGSLYVHTDIGDLTTTAPIAATFTGVGELGSIGAIEESTRLSPVKLDASLGLVDETADSIYEQALNQNFYQRPATFYLGFRNTVTGALVDTEVQQMFKGKIDNFNLTHGGILFPLASAARAVIESELVIMEEANGEMYSNVQMQKEYPGTASPLDPDTFFSHIERYRYRSVAWGPDQNVLPGTPPGIEPELNSSIRT